MASLAPQPSCVVDRPGFFVAGQGPTVVLLHASLGSKSQWTALAERLCTRFRVIGIDLHGYGDNTGTPAPAPFNVDEEVRIVLDCLAGLVDPYAKLHVVGHSYGGLVALRLAQRYAERVASLSLYEPILFRLLDENDADAVQIRRLVDRMRLLVATGFTHDAARAFVDFWSGDGTFDALPLPSQVAVARRAGKVLLDFDAACGWPRRPQDLAAITAPTLLMIGNRGPLLAQRIVDRLARALPGSHLAPFDCGHMGPVTHPERVNPWIEAFLVRVALAARTASSSIERQP
jgi:pimeloyl-ACP methyl ester carboxylesterase